MEEKWEWISGFTGRYMVSSLGRIKSVARVVKRGDGKRVSQRERILRPSAQRGYKRVVLSRNGHPSLHLVHRLVLAAFGRRRRCGEEANHKNFDRGDNRIENLEWCSREENARHKVNAGRHGSPSGMSHHAAIVDERMARKITAMLGEGMSGKAVAMSLGLSQTTVSRVRRGDHWTVALLHLGLD